LISTEEHAYPQQPLAQKVGALGGRELYIK